MAEQNVTTQQVLEAVRAQRGQIASLSALIGGIKERLTAGLQGELSPSAQAKLNEIMSEIQGNTRAITDAIATNDDDPSTVASDGTGGAVSGGAPGTAAGDTSGTASGTGGVAQTKPEQTDKVATTTSLSTSKAVVSAGEAVSLSAHVGGMTDKAITGTVVFHVGGKDFSASLDSTGVAAISISDMPAGDHDVVADYSGDAAYAPSTSNTITQTVMPADDVKPQQNPETGAQQAPQSTGDAAASAT